MVTETTFFFVSGEFLAGGIFTSDGTVDSPFDGSWEESEINVVRPPSSANLYLGPSSSVISCQSAITSSHCASSSALVRRRPFVLVRSPSLAT